jgi:hypothetical protein
VALEARGPGSKGESIVNKQELIRAILDIEWAMFQEVKSAVPAPCQLYPEAFSRIRGSVYETWTEEALQSCHRDFEKAKHDGRNLLTEKYARMDDLRGPSRGNNLIDKIVAIETLWQDEIRLNYPALYNRVCRSTQPFNDGRNFSVYLRSELETYSNRTIELYHQAVIKALASNENLALRSLEILVNLGGYRDPAHAEEYLARDGA